MDTHFSLADTLWTHTCVKHLASPSALCTDAGERARKQATRQRKRQQQLQDPPPVDTHTRDRQAAAAANKLLSQHTLRYQLPVNDEDIKAEHAPCAQTLLEQLLTAARIRSSIDTGKPVQLCAVCSCCVGSKQVHTERMPLAKLPNLELLAAEGVTPTEELPRSGITHLWYEGRKYCIDPAGATGMRRNNPSHIRVCTVCHGALQRNKVPDGSLVRVDTGPWAADEEGPLPEVTVVEELLLSSVTPLRRVMIMRPASGRCDPTTCKKQLTGHVVVLPGPPVEQLAAMLPRSFEEVAEHITVSQLLLTHFRHSRSAL